MENIKSIIESILFVASKPVTAEQLGKLLDTEQEQIQAALKEIADQRTNSGIVLLESAGTWQLATNSKNSSKVKSFLNAELREKLTDATIETLAIIAYRQPISRAEIEAIRGVNSQYSIRHLLIRGLIQKIPSKNDLRVFRYETTLEFLQHMGIQNINDLPEFETLVEKIKLPDVPQENMENTSPEEGI